MVSAGITHHHQIRAWRKRLGLWWTCRIGVALGGLTRMSERRFVFSFPVLNLYEVIKAVSAVEARHKLMNSNLAPYYGQAVSLNP